MTREEAKELLPIIKAFAEGKVIQCRSIISNEWRDFDEPAFNGLPDNYRIKPEPKYRPFKSQEECWNEMLKHQPFGWIRSNISGILYLIDSVSDEMSFNKLFISYKDVFECSKFADGTPFGIKEE